MILPKPLALIYIHFLDMSFLTSYHRSNDENDYIAYIKDKLSDTFSVSWSQGGTYGSCWDDEIREVAEEHEPNLDEFDQFIEQYFSDVSVATYKVINSCVDYNSTSESDYYGGCTSTGHKSVNLNSLSDVLIDLLYKDETDIIDFNDLILEHSKIVPQLDKDSYYKVDLYKDLKSNLNEKEERPKMKI